MGHDASDGSAFFNKIYMEAQIGQVEGGLYACNPATDYHYGTNDTVFITVLVHVTLLFNSFSLKFLNLGIDSQNMGETFLV